MKDSVTAPIVTVSSIEDHSFFLTVNGAKDNFFYSYAVLKGAPKDYDPSDILELAVKGSCVQIDAYDSLDVKYQRSVCACYEYAVQPSDTVTVTGLTQNQQYTVYAVASSKKGVVSQMVVQPVLTSDGYIPHVKADKYGECSVDDSDIDDGILYLALNEPCKLTGNGKAVAHYHAVNAYKKDDVYGYVFGEKFALDVPADSVSISDDGKTLEVHVPEVVPGAFVMITFDEGFIENGVGTLCEALDTHIAYYDDDYYFEGAGARFSTEKWELHNPLIKNDKGDYVRMPADTVIYYYDPEDVEMEVLADSLVTPDVNCIFDIDAAFDGEFGSILIKYYNAGTGRTVEYPSTEYIPCDDEVLVYLEEEADFGTYLSLTVQEGALQDIWGNPNMEYTTFDLSDEDEPIYGNYFYSLGYDLDDCIGKYEAVAVNYYTQSGQKVTFEIVASDDEEEGNVMFTTYMNAEGKLYADFNCDSGVLTIPEVFFNDENAVFANGDGQLTFSFVESGHFTNPSNYFGMAVGEGGQMTGFATLGGIPMVYYDIDAVRVE